MDVDQLADYKKGKPDNILSIAKIVLSIIFLILVSSVSVNAQDYKWTERIGSDGTDMGFATVTDDQGNVYLSGMFSETVDFNPGPGAINSALRTAEDGKSYGFVARYDENGNYNWVIVFKGTDENNVAIEELTLDNSGNIVAAGYFNGDAQIGEEGKKINTGKPTVLITKISPEGDVLWSNHIKSESGLAVFDIKVNHNDEIYLTGYFSDKLIIDNPDGFDQTYVSNGSVYEGDGYYVVYNSTGEYSTSNIIGGIQEDWIHTIAFDSNNNSYMLGVFSDTLRLEINGFEQEFTAEGSRDIFIMKLNGSDQITDVFILTGEGSISPKKLTIDEKDNLYISGNFTGEIDFNPGPGTDNIVKNSFYGFVTKLNKDEKYLWTLTLDANFIKVLTDENNFYITGTFDGEVDFNPGLPKDVYNSRSGSDDIFITKMNKKGIYENTIVYGGAYEDDISDIHINENNISAAGYFLKETDVIPGEETDIINSNGEEDIFFKKFTLSTTGIVDINDNSAKKIYPNPAQNEITLEFEGSMGKSEITVFDMNGTRVINQNIMTNEGANVYTLGTEALSSGQYVIRIVSGANSATFKAVIIK